MEPELPLGRRWPHTVLLEALLHAQESMLTLAAELDPEPSFEPLAQHPAAALLPLLPNFFLERRVWRLDTSSDWWDRLVLQQWDDDQWLRNFRMRKATFRELCTWLTPALQHQDTHLQPAIPVEKRIAIALWKLATPDSYRSVGHQFGVGKSTVGAVLMEVVTAINAELLHRTVRLGDLQTILAGFAGLGFPNCGGALDGTPSMPRPIERHSISIGRATSLWCCRLWSTTGDSSRMFASGGQAGHTMPVCSGTHTCTAGCRLGHSSPRGTWQSGMCRCLRALWPMRPTLSCPSS
ncbi:uncharacterized protein LOC142830452 [Pelodiscus sinensis]|uniref:uncharacterized protein LOC142830452 n=1 Tax=Pelodiscus sinensis TaxID=13735 RepID=UPI003F6D7586